MDQNALAIRRAQWEQIVAEGNAAGISKKEYSVAAHVIFDRFSHKLILNNIFTNRISE